LYEILPQRREGRIHPKTATRKKIVDIVKFKTFAIKNYQHYSKKT
jgi:hypothetical protein